MTDDTRTNGKARVGLMLYTVRDQCAEDFEGTVRAVAALGFEGVELFDLHGHEPAEVRGWLDELGLEPIGRHALLGPIESSLPALAAEAEVIGWNRLTVGWLDPATLEEPDLPGRLGRAAAEASALGLQLGFHNHDAEFRPLASGEIFLDLVPHQLYLELDLGWVWYSGADPSAVLDREAGRCPLVHVKDFRDRETHSFCPVGDGAVGYAQVLPAALSAGVEWLIVEQDETDGDPFEAVRRSQDAVAAILKEAA